MGGLIYWIVVGLIAGIIGKAIMPGGSKEPGGWVMTIILGIVGAFVGGFVGSLLGIGATNIIMQIVVATVGAIIVIAALRLLSGRKVTS